MELFVLSFALIGVATVTVSIEEWFHWLTEYKEAGAADLEWQKRQIKENYERFYRE